MMHLVTTQYFMLFHFNKITFILMHLHPPMQNTPPYLANINCLTSQHIIRASNDANPMSNVCHDGR